MTDAVLLVGHGTVDQLSELPDFLSRIRGGRPVSSELVHEITSRYRHIGGSPLLRTSNAQAAALQARLGLPCLVAMRMWHPLIADVLQQARERGLRDVLVLPLAPYSVEVYSQASQRAATERGLGDVTLASVLPWGSHPRLIQAWRDQIRPWLERDTTAQLVLTAHSLPTHVIRSGDRYQQEVSHSAAAIAAALGTQHHLAFQSQGADGGDWLGPTLQQTLVKMAGEGKRHVVVAPVGFLSDHVETLYDLDVEAKAQAEALGLQWSRVPALNDTPALIDALEAVARDAITQ
jgi:ferrochelatase